MKIINEKITVKNGKIAIVIARFNNFINENLLSGAIDTLKRIGKIKSKNITIIKVPGSFEIPIIIKNLIKFHKYDAIITLGTIIKGETEHYKYIAKQTSNGILKISIKKNIPISFGILITKNIEQAIERSGTKMGNKGSEAALCVLEMINIIKKIKKNKII